jgi:hypothetical protein
MKLTFAGFTGANKAMNPLNLPQGVGVDSQNQRPGRGDLRPWHAPSTVATVPASVKTIYRMGRDVPNDAAYWLSWSSDVDVVRSLIADDSSERTFWTGDGAPKWTDNTIGLAGAPYPSSSRTLGVPPPTTAPTITNPTPGSGNNETRYYLWTWVTDKGEESAPSPVSTASNAPADATYRVTFDNAIPSLRGINRKRLYRTVTGESGDTQFYLVVEVAAATTQFDDLNTKPNEPLQSLTWLEPPADLKGIKSLWDGIFAAFRGKSLRFCDPYRPFAWPIQYELPTDDAIVGLAVFQRNLLVLTTGRPYIVTGGDPASMSMEPLALEQSCVSKRSIVEFGHGVVYASPDGLTYVGSGRAPGVITTGLFMREDWQAIKPDTIIAAAYEGAYVASYNPGAGRVGFMCDPLQPSAFFYLSSGFDAAYQDPVTDALYVLNGTNVQKWDASAELMTALWKSGQQIVPERSFAWGRVIADAYPVTFDLFVNGTGRQTRTVNNGYPFRLPDKCTGTRWQVQAQTQNPVSAIVVADTVREAMEIQ